MASKSGSLIAIGGGVVLVYLGYTGYLGNVWNAVQGKGPAPEGDPCPEGQTRAPDGTCRTPQTGGYARPGTAWGGDARRDPNIGTRMTAYGGEAYGSVIPWEPGMGGDVVRPLPTGEAVTADNARAGQGGAVADVFYTLPSGGGGITHGANY